MFTSTDAPGVDHVAHEDTTIANLTRMGYLQYHLHSGIEEYVATNNSDSYALNNICAILHATIDSLLAALSDAVDVMVLKPVDVRAE